MVEEGEMKYLIIGGAAISNSIHIRLEQERM
jgi:hypothetical protein